MAALTRRVGRLLCWTISAPFGALILLSCLTALLLGAVFSLIADCFGRGVDCGRRRR